MRVINELGKAVFVICSAACTSTPVKSASVHYFWCLISLSDFRSDCLVVAHHIVPETHLLGACLLVADEPSQVLTSLAGYGFTTYLCEVCSTA